jgi:hypothetical protein
MFPRHKARGVTSRKWKRRAAPLELPMRPIATGKYYPPSWDIPSPSDRRWFQTSSRISNSAKHDGLAAHFDTRTIRGQSTHRRIERSTPRSVNDVWMLSSPWVTSLTISFSSSAKR